MDDSRSTAAHALAVAAAFNEAAVAIGTARMPYRALRGALAQLARLLDLRACAAVVDDGAGPRCAAAVGLAVDEPELRDLDPVTSGFRATWSVPLALADGRALGSLVVFESEPGGPNGVTVELARSYGSVLALGLDRAQRRGTGGRLQVAIAALTSAIDACDEYTARHSTETTALADLVAEQLGVDDVQAEQVSQVAALHDIGKLGVPTQVLTKQGPLTDEEWVLMRRHPVIGERILASIPELRGIAKAVRHEHERWDGQGYPDGVAREQIPLASRIVLACDAWHAMTSDRPYRNALPRAEGLAELRRNAGTQFDPRVIRALLEVLGEPALAIAVEHAGEAPTPPATRNSRRVPAIALT